MTAVGWQKLEGALAAVAGLALVVVLPQSLSWWIWPVLLLLPDLSMAGYVAGPRVGAAVYNVAHLYAIGPALAVVGVAVDAPIVTAAGALWLAHVGFDRWLGYGLKLPTDFKDTHLGRIGR